MLKLDSKWDRLIIQLNGSPVLRFETDRLWDDLVMEDYVDGVFSGDRWPKIVWRRTFPISGVSVAVSTRLPTEYSISEARRILAPLNVPDWYFEPATVPDRDFARFAWPADTRLVWRITVTASPERAIPAKGSSVVPAAAFTTDTVLPHLRWWFNPKGPDWRVPPSRCR